MVIGDKGAVCGGVLPPSVCVRVTRACNARCGFCLAPPRGHGVDFDEISRRLCWLAAVGVQKVNLSGGEPTIRNDLPRIVREVAQLGLVGAMTTNAIRLRPDVLDALAETQTKVKVSVHGPSALHDEMLGRRCFDIVDRNLSILLSVGVPTAVQTVVTRRWPAVYEWMVDYCLRLGVRKLRLVPFVPRGRGLATAASYQLEAGQRAAVEATIKRLRPALADRLDIDVLDFWHKEYFVMETDGRLQIQRETDAADSTVATVG